MKKEIIVLDKKYARLAPLIQRTLTRIGTTNDFIHTHLEVYLVGDSFMKKNVLSFPAPGNFPRPDLKKYRSLGELYLNPGYIKRHNENLVYMLIHGALHLLGYDHHTKRDTMAMEKKEQELLALL